jgi:hypothetical protein
MNHGVFIFTVVALQGLHSASLFQTTTSLFQTNFYSYGTVQPFINYAQLLGLTRGALTRVYGDYLRLDYASYCTDESLFTSGYPERVFDLNHDFIISGVWCSFKSPNLTDSGQWQLATCDQVLITYVSPRLIIPTPSRRDWTSHVAYHLLSGMKSQPLCHRICCSLFDIHLCLIF